MKPSDRKAQLDALRVEAAAGAARLHDIKRRVDRLVADCLHLNDNWTPAVAGSSSESHCAICGTAAPHFPGVTPKTLPPRS